MCDPVSSHSWILVKLVEGLNLSGGDLNLAINGINMDELKVAIVTVHNPALQSKFPYLAPTKQIVYNYADVYLLIGPSMLFGPKSNLKVRPIQKTCTSLAAFQWAGS